MVVAYFFFLEAVIRSLKQYKNYPSPIKLATPCQFYWQDPTCFLQQPLSSDCPGRPSSFLSLPKCPATDAINKIKTLISSQTLALHFLLQSANHDKWQMFIYCQFLSTMWEWSMKGWQRNRPYQKYHSPCYVIDSLQKGIGSWEGLTLILHGFI